MGTALRRRRPELLRHRPHSQLRIHRRPTEPARQSGRPTGGNRIRMDWALIALAVYWLIAIVTVITDPALSRERRKGRRQAVPRHMGQFDHREAGSLGVARQRP